MVGNSDHVDPILVDRPPISPYRHNLALVFTFVSVGVAIRTIHTIVGRATERVFDLIVTPSGESFFQLDAFYSCASAQICYPAHMMQRESKVAKNAKISQIWTVRNASGQFLGTFRALTTEQAIASAKQAAGVYYQTFSRRAAARSGGIKLDDLTAQVETQD